MKYVQSKQRHLNEVTDVFLLFTLSRLMAAGKANVNFMPDVLQSGEINSFPFFCEGKHYYTLKQIN